MSELKVNKISPETATSLTVGTSGDTVTVPSGATLDVSNATVNLPITLTVATELKTNKISPASGTTFTMGDSGDAFTVPAGVTLTNSGTATGFGGALTKISSTTFTNQANVSITTGIDSTYDVYIFKYFDVNPATDNKNFEFQGSIDGGSSYGVTITSTSFRAYHYEDDGSAVLEYKTATDLAQSTDYQILGREMGNASDECLSGELFLFNPSSTTYVKHFYSTNQMIYTGDASMIYYQAGYFNNTNDIDAINFKMSSGNFDGTIQLWGL